MALLGKNITQVPAKRNAYKDTFDERAGQLEFVAGYERPHAEFWAGIQTLKQAMEDNRPIPSLGDARCSHCQGKGDLVAVKSAGKGIRVHQSCLVAFLNAWIAVGKAAIAGDDVQYRVSNQAMAEALAQMGSAVKQEKAA